MPSESSFKDNVAKYRRQLASIGGSDGRQQLLKEMQSYVDRFPDDSNRKICAAHLAKELVDWIAQKPDDVVETEPGKSLMVLLEHFLAICHTAQDAIRSFCVARLYNAVITLNAKSDSQLLRLRVCGLMSQFPMENGQVELFDRLKRVVLKTIQDWSAKGSFKKLQEEGIDFIIEVQRKQLIHAAGKELNSNEPRAKALNLFRELFDTSLAMLYRVFSICRPKAQQLYNVVMETMATVVRPDEAELITLLNDSVGFVETIINFSGEDGEFLKFTKFLTIFAGINREPYISCYQLLTLQLQLQQKSNPTGRDIAKITSQLRTLHAEHASNALVVRVAVFLTCQGSAFIHRLTQEAALTCSEFAIELFQSLMPFVRHCATGTVAELCRTCTSSRRHMAERLITIILQLCIFQLKDAAERKASGAQQNTVYPTDRVRELITKKLDLLGHLGCDRKRALIDNTVRQSVTWVKYAIPLLREDRQGMLDSMEVLKVVKLMVSTQNVYNFDFLTDSHLIRLLENCYIERPDCTPAEASALCWGSVSVRMLKLILAVRENASTANDEEQSAATISAIVRAILFSQINAPEGDPIRAVDTVELFLHPQFDRHGFTFDVGLTRKEKFIILAKEMALAVKYKTPLSRTPWDYFLRLQELGSLQENCLTFGMALYGFNDNEAERIPTETMDRLYASLACFKPTNTAERITRSASMGMGSYLSFSVLSRVALNRVRNVPFKIEHFRNDQIDELLVESQLDRETSLIDLLESIREHYGDMIAALAEENFRTAGVLPSVVQIGSILDNVARFYQLNHYPHRAVELQLQNLLFVSQGRDERPLEQCAPLAFLLEHGRQTEELIDRFSTGTVVCCQAYAATKLGPMENLAKRATVLLESYAKNGEQFANDVPENRKYQFLNLFLGLAVYRASCGQLEQSLELIRRTLALLPPTETFTCAGEVKKDEAKPLSGMETIGVLVRGRVSQIIFRLVVEYELSWPCTTDGAVPPITTFLKAMLTRFNDLQKLPNKHTFVVSLATVEVTVAVLQYLIVRYDTGSLIEPYVEQLLKFVLRRGAGLRVMQVLLLYGHMNADMQKLDRCEVSLRYLQRVLMLRPITPTRSPYKEDARIEVESPMLPIKNVKGLHHSGQRLPRLVSPVGADSDCDGERKAVPKQLENEMMFTKARMDSALEKESTQPTTEQYLMFQHSSPCRCCYCRYPQYKCMAFQSGALAARLSALQRAHRTEHVEHSYQTIADHWLTALEPATGFGWFSVGYRTDLFTAVIRMFVQWSQFLGSLCRFEPALHALDQALQLSDRIEQHVCLDPALLEDVSFHRTTMGIAQKRAGAGHSLRYKRSRSMIQTHFQQLVAAGKIECDRMSPPAGTIASLSVELNKLLLTPTQPPSSAQGVKVRVPPKTVDRVNELIRQAASRRHQLKNSVSSGADESTVTGVAAVPSRSYSASARKPKTVNIFVDSPPSAVSSRKQPTTVGKPLTVPVSSAKASSSSLRKDERTGSEVTEIVPTPVGAAAKGDRKRRVAGKRALLQEDLTTPAKTSMTTFKDALVTSSRARTPEMDESNRDRNGNRRCFKKNDFPSLKASGTTTQTPLRTVPKQVTTPGVGECASPGLNGSFRDALVLGGGRGTKNDSTTVIVLDDSADSRQSSEEAVEASFIDAAVTVAAGDNNSALSLKSYSDRKRMLQASGGGGSGLTPSSRMQDVLTKRKTPYLASKTKLRFDDPSPEQKEAEQCSPNTPSSPARTDTEATTPHQKGHAIDTLISKGLISTRKPSRKRICPVTANDDDESAKTESNIMPTEATTIASRTRQRRKRI